MFPDLPSGPVGIQTNSLPEGKENPEAVSVKSQAPIGCTIKSSLTPFGSRSGPVGQMIELARPQTRHLSDNGLYNQPEGFVTLKTLSAAPIA